MHEFLGGITLSYTKLEQTPWHLDTVDHPTGQSVPLAGSDRMRLLPVIAGVENTFVHILGVIRFGITKAAVVIGLVER